MRMFQQLSKEMLYKYVPDVKDIPYDGRGLLKKHYSPYSTIIFEALKKIVGKKSNSILWDRKKAFTNDITSIQNDLKRVFDYPDLLSLLNKEFLDSIINSQSRIIDNFLLVEKILSFLYAYEIFIDLNELKIPIEIIRYYGNSN